MQRILGVLALWLALCVVPPWLVGQSVHGLLSGSDRITLDQHRQQLDQALTAISTWPNPEAFLGRLLQDHTARALHARDGGRRLRRTLASLRRRFPGLLEFVVLDASGRVMVECSDSPMAQSPLWPQFLAEVRAVRVTRDKHGGTGDFRSIAGPHRRPGSFRSVNLKRICYHRQRCLLIFVSDITDQGMVVAYVNRDPSWQCLPYRESARSFNRRPTAVRVGSYDVRDGVPEQVEGMPLQGPALALMLMALETSPRPVLRDDRLWVIRRVTATVRTVATVPCPLTSRQADRQARLMVLSCGVSALLTLVLGLVMTGRWRPRWSLRAQSLGLLLAAAVAPVLVLALIAQRHLHERAQTLEDGLFAAMDQRLATVDRNYPTFVGQLGSVARRALTVPVATGAALVPIVQRRLDELATLVPTQLCGLVDLHGEFVWTRPGTGIAIGWVMYLGKMLGNVLRECRGDLAPIDVQAEELVSHITGLDSMLSPEAMVKQLHQFVDRIGRSKMLVGDWFIYLYPCGRVGARPDHLAVLMWHDRDVARAYVEQGGGRLCALARGWWPAILPRSSEAGPGLPRQFAQGAFAKALGKRLEYATDSLRERSWHRGRGYLVTARRAQSLIGHNLVGVVDLAAIDAPISQIKRDFVGFAMLMILLLATVVLTLKTMFLVPIGHLGRGIASLRQRRIGEPLPVLTDDELGALTTAFNDMMANMADLEVARIVQERLFPQVPLTVGGCTVYGTVVCASAVGGDYFDYFPVGDGRLAVVVGDVSGHGVGAALVMAMAKALIAHPATPTEPATMLKIINGVFCRILGRQKMMTCLVLLVDPANSNMAYCSAGHCDPFIVRAGRVTQPISRHLPLGARQRGEFRVTTVELQPGDTVVLYSDGLVEAQKATGGMVGFDGVEAALPELVAGRSGDGDPVAMVARIRRWHHELTQTDPPHDDVTLVALHCRNPHAPAATA